MSYQYKREPLNNDEVNKLTNFCSTFQGKFVIWTLLDVGLRLYEFTDLKKENIQEQEKRLFIYGKGGLYDKKTKGRIIPMIYRIGRLIEYNFAENKNTRKNKRTIERIVKKQLKKLELQRKPVRMF